MFATEESVLQYFYEQGEPLNIKELEARFDNSTWEEILAAVTAIEQKNQIIYSGSAQWALTNIGIRDYLKQTESNYDKRNYTIAIISAAISLVSLIVSIRSCKG
jgi:hypothetical protein